jgi:hypothetical protein
MEPLQQNLERNYNSFIERESPMAFFKGLAEYLDYVLEEPELKNVMDENMTERAAGLAKIDEFEQKAYSEMQAAKEKLLKIIKKKHVDLTLFKRLTTFAGRPFNNVIEELEAYEEGGISTSGYRSDNLHRYLFEVAANLKVLGYENLVKEFLVTPEEYMAYYDRINGQSMYYVSGNEHGNFVFSQTWPERFRAAALLEAERDFKSWSAFEALLRFKRAYDEASRNRNFSDVLREGADIFLTVDDTVEVAFMIEDLKVLSGNGSSTMRARYSHRPDDLKHLHKSTFKTHAQTAHNRFMRSITSGRKASQNITSFNTETSTLNFRNERIEISKNRNSDPHYLLSIIFKDPSKVWAFDEIWEDPYFRSHNGTYNPKTDWRKIYNAGYSVNERVQKATKTRGFLDLSKTSIQVSRDFL